MSGALYSKTPTSFAFQFITNFTRSSLNFSQTCGCLFIILAYITSNKRFLWNILFAMSVCAILGTSVESYFTASKIFSPNVNISFILGINEINWIISESSIVIYSLTKLETAVTSQSSIKVIRSIVFVLLTAFAACRIHIGVLRVQKNTIFDLPNETAIASGHSLAYSTISIAEIILFIWLAITAFVHLKEESIDVETLRALCFSSIPRILVITIDMLLIMIVGLNIGLEFLTELEEIVWSIKGIFPFILFFDLIMTNHMLLIAKNNKVKDSFYSTGTEPKESLSF